MTRRRVTPSTPEPRVDIEAQVRAMRDPKHPKDAVFVAAGNEDALPAGRARGERRVQTEDGTLLTNNAEKARAFGRGVDDAQMARMLGYPQPKDAAIVPGVSVVQARDRAGAVVSEAVASPDAVGRTAKALKRQMPEGGSVVRGTPQAMQARRQALRGRGE
jgi:hypothetical protein